MAFILGKKIEMSQVFKDDIMTPITKIKAGPCYITQIKTKEKDGYQAVQIGFSLKKKINKPQTGHLKKVGKNLRHLREFRIPPLEADQPLADKYKVGDEIKVDIFKPGDKLKISGISKGKGFAGVVKRHGFHGQPSTHGHKDQSRMPGSIGATAPQRVFKGKKMAGRMGNEKVTVANLEVIEVNPEKNLLVVKGAVPGVRSSLLEIKS